MYEFTATDYKSEMKSYVESLHAKVSAREITTAEAQGIVQGLTDAYVESTGERPDYRILERLGTVLLYDTYSDTYQDKMTRDEYPIESPTQETRRVEGRHQAKDIVGRKEVSFVWALEIASNGEDMRPLTRTNNRKMREALGQTLRDKEVQARNKDRRKRRNAFIRGDIPGAITVRISDGKVTRRPPEEHNP